MAAGVTTTTALPVRSLAGTGAEAVLASLGKSPEARAALQKSLQEAQRIAAAEIPDDNDVPSDVTDLLRQLDTLSGGIGSDNDPNAHRLDGSGPVAPRFQDTLAQLRLKVQAATAGKGDDAKGAILAYVSHALSVIDNKFHNTQDNLSILLSRGGPQQILPNGKGQGTNSFDEIQTQRDSVKDALNSLLGSSASLGNLVDQFSKASYAGLKASEQAPSADKDFKGALGILSDTLARLKNANTDLQKSFLTHLVNDFGAGLNTTFTEQQRQLAQGLATATDPATIGAIKSISAQLDGYKDLTSNTFAKLLQQVSGLDDQQAFSRARTGLFFDAKA